MNASRKGFTLIELLIVVAIIGLLASLSMFALRNEQKKRRDVQRVSNIGELQKALALHAASQGGYPVMTGCVNGSDTVSLALSANGYVSVDSRIADPLLPDDITKCYRYDGTGSAYTLTFTLETDSIQGYDAGDHVIIP